MSPKPLIILAALATTATVILPAGAKAQPYPWYAEFVGPCILPRQSTGSLIPFDSIDLLVSASPESILATFPLEWQGRTRIGLVVDVREPGMLLIFNPPLDLTAIVLGGEPEFDPPPLEFQGDVLIWPSSLDSLKVNWPPWEPLEIGSSTYFHNDCPQILFGGPGVVTADATLNVLGVYASDVDTVMVWGSEFGWPDLRITAQRHTFSVSVEAGTWGRIKASMLERSK